MVIAKLEVLLKHLSVQLVLSFQLHGSWSDELALTSSSCRWRPKHNSGAGSSGVLEKYEESFEFLLGTSVDVVLGDFTKTEN